MGVSNLYLTQEPSEEEVLKEIKNSIDKNNSDEIKKVKICGYGEPMTRVNILPNIVKLIRKKCRNSTIQLTTTGWIIYHIKEGEESFKESVKQGLDQIYLGIHSTNTEDYGKIVRPSIDEKEAFNQIIKFIRLSQQLNLRVRCSFVDIKNLSEKKVRKFTNKLNCEYDIREFEK